VSLCPWTSRQQAFNRATGVDKFTGKTFSEITGRDVTPKNLFYALLCGAGNDATRHGTSNEANGVLAYSTHTGNLVENTGLHVHPHTPWLAGSPDGLIGTDGLLEVKCPYYYRKNGARLHKEIPMHYYMQLNLCLEITERKWCDFITWAPEGYRIYRVLRDNALHDAMLPHYTKFFSSIQRSASQPPTQTDEEKESITCAVKESMQNSINYTFWDRVDTEDTPPCMDEIEEPPAKRQRAAGCTGHCQMISSKHQSENTNVTSPS